MEEKRRPPIDKNSLELLEFIHIEIRRIIDLSEKKEGETLREFAEKCKIGYCTASRMGQRPNPDESRRYEFDAILRFLEGLLGEFPFKIIGKKLFTNLPYHANSDLIGKFAQEVKEMPDDDVQLVFKFLEVLKNKQRFEKVYWDIFLGFLHGFSLAAKAKPPIGIIPISEVVQAEEEKEEPSLN